MTRGAKNDNLIQATGRRSFVRFVMILLAACMLFVSAIAFLPNMQKLVTTADPVDKISGVVSAQGWASSNTYTPSKIFPVDVDATDVNAYTNRSAWYDSEDLRYKGGVGEVGSEGNPYIIKTGYELAYLAELVNGEAEGIAAQSFENQYIRLDGTSVGGEYVIDLIGTGGLIYAKGEKLGWLPCDPAGTSPYGWKPIGKNDTPFKGNIYGNPINTPVIYNLSGYYTANTDKDTPFRNSLNYGLFGVVEGATFENIRLKKVQLLSLIGNSQMGSLIGRANSGVTIKNCSAEGLDDYVEGKNAGETGDAVYLREIKAGEEGSLNEQTYYIADMAIRCSGGNAAIGGLVGRIEAPNGTVSITGCEALRGTIMHGNKYGASTALGGVVGYCNANKITISDIKGTADISTPPAADTTHNMVRAGGVVGYLAGGKETDGTAIANVGTKDTPFRAVFRGYVAGVNAGNNQPNATTANGGVGGIVGANSGAPLTIGGSTEKACYVKVDASLTSTGASNNGLLLGGILGRWGWGSSDCDTSLLISHCQIKGFTLVPYVVDKAAVVDQTATSVGGIVGGVDSGVALTNGMISDCTVSDAKICADGLVGGIIGAPKASNLNSAYAYLQTIINCTVNNFRVYQSSESPSYAVFGGIAVHGYAGSISSCNVKGFHVYSLIPQTNLIKAAVGGICASASGTLTISDCTAETFADVGNYSNANGDYSVGGIVGAHSASNVTNCAAKVEFVACEKYNYQIDYVAYRAGNEREARGSADYSFDQSAQNMGAVMAGGLIGQWNTSSGAVVSNCFSTGNINFSLASGKTDTRSNALGGLVGVTGIPAKGTACSIENCFSSVSLDGEIRDAIGGLIAYNTDVKLTLSTCHFGGILLDPNAASLVAYSPDGLTASGLTYRAEWAPNAPSADNKTSGETKNFDDSGVKISSVAETEFGKYYALAAAAANAALGRAGNNVFACESWPESVTADYEKTTLTTSAGDYSVTRKVKYVKLQGDDVTTADGTSFSVNDLAAMQKYVAAGGGFLGAQFTLAGNVSITSNWTPIGNIANSTFTYSAEGDQPFLGTFDGNGYEIQMKASFVDRTYKVNNTTQVTPLPNGIFGYVRHAEIKNVTINYTGAATLSGNYLGGVVGRADYSAIHSVNMTFGAELTFTASANGYGGGIVGYAFASSLTNVGVQGSSNAVKVNPNVNCNFGGLVGCLDGSRIEGGSCVATIEGVSGARTYLGGLSASTEYNVPTFTFAKTDQFSVNVLAETLSPKASNSFFVGIVGLNKSHAYSRHVGGIFGRAAAGAADQIENCFAFANVIGAKASGGLIGVAASGAQQLVVNSYFKGTITSYNHKNGEYASYYAGGIVGYVEDSRDTDLVSNTYFVGQIVSGGTVGALTGSSASAGGFTYDVQVAGNLHVTESIEDDDAAELTTLDVNMSSDGYYGDVTHISNVWDKATLWDKAAREVVYHFSPDGKEGAATATASNFSAGDTLTEKGTGTYSHEINIPVSYDKTNKKYTVSGATDGGQFTVTYTYKVTEEGYELGVTEIVYVMPATAVDIPALEGEGTKTSPFLIKNVEELKLFRDYINNVYGGAGLYFKLVPADASGYLLTDAWVPIGSVAQPFQGTLIGNGSTISGMNVDASTLKENAAGLFGYTSGADISGIVLKNSSISLSEGTIDSEKYIGGLAGRASNTTISDCSVECDITIQAAIAEKKNINVGVSVGQCASDAVLSGILAIGDITLRPAAALSSEIRMGMVGSVLAQRDVYCTTEISGCVAYGNYTFERLASSKGSVYAGGLVGYTLGDWESSNLTLNVSDVAFYGKIDCENSSADDWAMNVGGILGRINNWKLSLKNAVSTATVQVLMSSASTCYVGGMVGNLASNAALDANAFSDVGFWGELNVASNATSKKVGGLIGYSNNRDSIISNIVNHNEYDATKNPDIKALGYENKGDLGKTTAELANNDDMYRCPQYATGFTGFGNDAQRALAAKIIKGQSVVLYLVRTDKVIKPYGEDNYIHLTSAYVLADNVSVTAGESITDESTRVYTAKSSDNLYRRLASKSDDFANPVSVSLLSDDFTEGRVNYGKRVVYVTSVEAIAKRDLSPYLFAKGYSDPVFPIYNADQLMGLDALLTSAETDDFGNRLTLKYTGKDYTAALQTEIDFSVWQGKFNSIGGSFGGTLDGNYHVIFNLVQKVTDVGGLFSVLDGATIKNVGMADCVFTAVSGATSSSSVMGSFAAKAKGTTTFSETFSSVRLETQKNVQSYIGGFVGIVESGTATIGNSYFTGSIGPCAENGVYPAPGATWVAGGFVGANKSNLRISDSYVASYIYSNAEERQYGGLFIGYSETDQGTNVNPTCAIENCRADLSAAVENAKVVGNGTAVFDGSAPVVTNGLYPAVGSWKGQSDMELASRAAVKFEPSAHSTNKASLTYAGAVFGYADARNGLAAANGAAGAELYLLSEDGKTLTRNNTGLGSVFVQTNGGARLVAFNLRSWYDKYETNAANEHVYTIKTLADFNELADMVALRDKFPFSPSFTDGEIKEDVAKGFRNCVVQLGADIVGSFAQDGVGAAAMVGAGSGASAKLFEGTFDGNGFAFENITLSNVSDAGRAGRAGLFGTLGAGAVVKNVSLKGMVKVQISGDAAVVGGGIVAEYTEGTVKNCYNGARITVEADKGTLHFGGITGRVGDGKVLEYCYNMGRISAATGSTKILLGGIAGRIESNGTVKNCYNTGMIEGAYNEASPTDKYTVIAGISPANAGTISMCYNAAVLRYGRVYHPVSIVENGGSAENCYADGQFLAAQYSYDAEKGGGGYEYETGKAGVVVLSSEALSAGTQLNDWNATDWTYAEGYYPQFNAKVADTAFDSIKTMSLVSAIAPRLVNVEDGVAKTATFEAFTEVSFRCGVDFTIEAAQGYAGTFGFSDFKDGETVVGKKLTVVKRGAAILSYSCGGFTREGYFVNEDTLEVRYMFDFSSLLGTEETTKRQEGSYVDPSSKKKLVAEAGKDMFFPKEQVNGNGTASYPYLIHTTADLLAFAKYVNEGGITLGRYFKMIGNINMTGKDWIPVGTRTYPFKGNFSGGGYTVSGIAASKRQYCGLFGYAASGSVIQLVAVKESTFTADTTAESYTGAIAGYTEGLIANVWTTARIDASVGASKAYIGGLVGYIGPGGVLRAAYVRVEGQGEQITGVNHPTINASGTKECFIGGILAGYNAGTIRGCYHTAVCYTTATGSLTPNALVGECAAERNVPKNSYYCHEIGAFDVLYTLGGVKVEARNGATILASNFFAKTRAEMIKTESAGTTDGVANDSLALLLSQDMYLGAFEQQSLSASAATAENTNDGYPMLTAFDLLQYEFKSFDTESLVLCIKNSGASNQKLMNALCDYGMYDFPTYAQITALEKLDIDVFSLPKAITYNVSVVAYGVDEDGNALKWTVLNGVYTEGWLSQAGGSGMVSSQDKRGGTFTITFNQKGVMPDGCRKIYVYITLLKGDATSNDWGIDQEWNSSTEQPFPEDATENGN